jgi:2,3-diaminopropionate biosynthesis protein SbnA
MIYDHILSTVGNTPMIRLRLEEFEHIHLYAKVECFNPTGSVKDRAASYVIKKLLENKEIDRNTTMIESSSGNFGIALSAYCKLSGLRFICVVDPCISPMNEMLIKSFGAEVIKVTTPDENGGYLLNRIRKVKQLVREIDNSYWVNQYGNPYNAEAYYYSLGGEICNDMDHLDYIFLGISSGGTITGVSRRVKENFPEVKVIAVDIIGSVIFGHPPQKRYIPGIGSSMVPDILNHSRIDHVVMMDEVTTIRMCHELLERYNIFAGGSSGSAYGAVKKYFNENPVEKPGRPIHVVTVLPDRGERYCNNVYNDEWCKDFMEHHAEKKEI